MLFEVILRQRYDGKNVINRWHYSGAGTPAAVQMSYALTYAFGGIVTPITNAFRADTVMLALYGVQHSTLQYLELQVQAMYDVADFFVVPFPPTQAGSLGGTPMSSFAAYALQSNRLRTDIHRGNKRLAGVSETYVGTNGVIESAMATALEGVAERMSAILEYDDEGNTLSFTPVVLGFEKHDPDEDHEDYWYSKWPTNAAQLSHAAVGVTWSSKAFMTTQNTRKR